MGRGPEGESLPPLLGGSGAQHILGVMIHFRPQMSVVLRLSSPAPRREVCPRCHPQRLPSPHRCPSGGPRPSWLALLATTAQTCCRGPLLHQAVTCVGRTRGGQFCSLCVLHGRRGPGWFPGGGEGGQGPGNDRESCRVGGLPELGHSVQPWAQADTVSSLPTVSEWDSLGFPTRWAPFSLMSPPQSREGVDMPQSGRGVGRDGACLPHPAWGLLPICGSGERVEACVPGETPQMGSLDTRSLSSDGSGGWKSKINVPTGLFPLRPLSLQVDRGYPLVS